MNGGPPRPNSNSHWIASGAINDRSATVDQQKCLGAPLSEQLLELVQWIGRRLPAAIAACAQQAAECASFFAEEPADFPLSRMRRRVLRQHAYIGNNRGFRQMADDAQRDFHLTLRISQIGDIVFGRNQLVAEGF